MGKCKQTFRGHVDSINELCWLPYSNTLATASSDKTLSLWDARSGLCAQSFYGHMNRHVDEAVAEGAAAGRHGLRSTLLASAS